MNGDDYKRNFIITNSNRLRLNVFSHLFDYLSSGDLQLDGDFEEFKKDPSNLLISIFNSIFRFKETFKILFVAGGQSDAIGNQNELIFKNLELCLCDLSKFLYYFSVINDNRKVANINFPYQEMYFLLLNGEMNDNYDEIKPYILGCLAKATLIDVSFDISTMPTQVIDYLVKIVTNLYEFRENISNYVEFIANLIQQSSSLCNLFASKGLFQVFDDYLPFPFAVYALESVILSIDKSMAKTILKFCMLLITKWNNPIIQKGFHCFSLYMHRFGFNGFERKQIILLNKVISNYIENNYLDESVYDLILRFPSQSPPDLLIKIVHILMNPIIDNNIEVLCLSVLIKFSESWINLVEKTFVYDMMAIDFESKDFQTQEKYAECIISYHHCGDAVLDINVVKMCINFFDSAIYKKCLFSLYQTISFLERSTQDLQANGSSILIDEIFPLFNEGVIDSILSYTSDNDCSAVAESLVKLVSRKSDE